MNGNTSTEELVSLVEHFLEQQKNIRTLHATHGVVPLGVKYSQNERAFLDAIYRMGAE